MSVQIGLKTSWILCLVAPLAFLAGCAGATSETAYTVDLVAVTGTVTLDDEPAEGVDVVFTPIEGSTAQTRAGFGRTDANGVYSIYSPPGGAGVDKEKFQGLLPGVYKVSFSRFVTADGTVYDPETATEGPMTLGAVETIPPEYVNPQTSPFEAELTFEDTETFDFDVKTAGK